MLAIVRERHAFSFICLLKCSWGNRLLSSISINAIFCDSQFNFTEQNHFQRYRRQHMNVRHLVRTHTHTHAHTSTHTPATKKRKKRIYQYSSTSEYARFFFQFLLFSIAPLNLFHFRCSFIYLPRLLVCCVFLIFFLLLCASIPNGTKASEIKMYGVKIIVNV